jgi:hypothetical protein
MAHVSFTRHLQRYFPDLGELDLPATTLRELVTMLEAQHPGLAAYLVEDDGSLRKHVNVFVENRILEDRRGLSDPLRPDSRVHILQALSGG